MKYTTINKAYNPSEFIERQYHKYTRLLKFNTLIISLCSTAFTISISSCKKLIQIPPPVSTITTSQVFSSDDQATSAMAGLYFKMINGGGLTPAFCSGAITIYSGMSSDELKGFNQTNNNNTQFQNNTLSSSNPIILSNFWTSAYTLIYGANAIIEGLNASSGVHDSLKNELIGEAKFARAFCNFYLINLFGDIPLITTTNWNNTSLVGRTSMSQIYEQIVNDLKEAQGILSADYSVGSGQRIIPNKWAATALLAKVYLYTGDWANSEAQATSVINNISLFKIEPDLKKVFLLGSTEAIWQLQQTNATFSYNATMEGYTFIPASPLPPSYYITDTLLNSFDSGDNRKDEWIKSVIYQGKTYYYPYKYKTGRQQATINNSYTEYYMALRLTEQYLIRAEARALQNLNLADAISDLNIIRNRAGLPDISPLITQTDLLSAIAHERKIELFAEWGNRWLDLKRTGQSTAVLGPIKSSWTVNSQLYPIPVSELKVDPNLTQNAGY